MIFINHSFSRSQVQVISHGTEWTCNSALLISMMMTPMIGGQIRKLWLQQGSQEPSMIISSQVHNQVHRGGLARESKFPVQTVAKATTGLKSVDNQVEEPSDQIKHQAVVFKVASFIKVAHISDHNHIKASGVSTVALSDT